MSSFCTSCGAPGADGAKFCTACGNRTGDVQPAQDALPAHDMLYQQQAATVPTEAAPIPPAYSTATDAAPPKGSKYTPISTLGYIGWMILMGLPLIGLIIAIILARGNGPVNRRNLARALLVFFGIVIVVSVAAFVMAWPVLSEIISVEFGT